MHRTMTLKGFILILFLILAVFLVFHLLMKGDLTRKAEQEEALREALAQLQEEEKDLRFEFSNPEALYTYSEEELRILVDEMAD